jgi:hypothetical protein
MNSCARLDPRLISERGMSVRIVRTAAICGLILYYGVIPIEFVITGQFRVSNDIFEVDLNSSVILDSILVVGFAFTGFLCGTQLLARTTRTRYIHARESGECAARIAAVVLSAFLVAAFSSGAFQKSVSVESAATLDSDPGIASSSLLLTAAAAVSSVALSFDALGRLARFRVAILALLVIAIGGLGLLLGDKDPFGAAVLAFIGSLAFRTRNRLVSGLLSVGICISGLLVVPAASAAKFWLFGIEPSISQMFTRPSRSDPGGAFAMMASAMERSIPLEMAGYNPVGSLSADLASVVPKWLWLERPQSPGASLSRFLMGSSYAEGYGVGYSPYLDLYCALGVLGIFISGVVIGLMVSVVLVAARVVDRRGVLECCCALVSFYVIIVSQRLSLVGSVKQLVYYNVIVISAFIISLGVKHILSSGRYVASGRPVPWL